MVRRKDWNDQPDMDVSSTMAPLLAIFVLCYVCAAEAAATKTDIAEARNSESGRTFGALLPLSLTLMPLLAPVISKGVFMVLLSGVVYLALFVGSFFFPALGGLIGLGPIGLRSFESEFDSSENSIDRVTRVVRQAIETTEESVTGGTTECRRRLVCELSKAVSDGVPTVDMFDNYFRNRTEDADSYASAWASGWLQRDCARFYKDCDRASMDSLSAIITVLGGPDGYFGSILSRFTNNTAPPTETPTPASWLATTLRTMQTTTTPPPLFQRTEQPSWTTVVQNLVTLAATEPFQRYVSSQTTSAPESTRTRSSR
ncbi:hypothetical protein HPB50_014703 [Hyalomma asiaticum]|uniref:Uncharacterized protein n=1 Tax=Hyalomma asiaticum TaxID=266040 RepID=A0ACB7S0T8_HYAAI|nr:hypothetical protein HPB50_014703 [Hyalomma asiaticum]